MRVGLLLGLAGFVACGCAAASKSSAGAAPERASVSGCPAAPPATSTAGDAARADTKPAGTSVAMASSAASAAVPATVGAVNAGTAPPSAAPAYREVELPGTQVRELASELTGKQHRLLIALPPSFGKEPDRRYPVLFVLDGQWDFPLVATLSGGLRFDEVLPELLIVGLSWGGDSPNYDALRSDDYLPTRAKGRDGVEKGGGAPRFLTFLEQSVIPLLEREYRADPQHRIIAGTSNGGLFTLYALFEKPELFWGYVAISPNVGWDNRAVFDKERAFRAGHAALGRRLWLSSGSAEWPDYRARELDFFRQLKASRYTGLALEVFEIAGERHAGVKPEAYNRALRFITAPLLPSKR